MKELHIIAAAKSDQEIGLAGGGSKQRGADSSAYQALNGSLSTVAGRELGDSLVSRLERLPLILLPVSREPSLSELTQQFPDQDLLVCDCYIGGIEHGEPLPYGYRMGRVLNIDHHAPTREMTRMISTGNLAALYVAEHGPFTDGKILINHTDCDSVLGALIVGGVLPPTAVFTDAVIAADHTWALNDIADLLQALASAQDVSYSVRNLELLLKAEPLEEAAQKALLRRHSNREKARELVASGKYENENGVYYFVADSKFDAGFLVSLLPQASIVMLASPHRKFPERMQVSLRLGLGAKDGLSLHDLNISGFDPNFGGRWNAGSNTRGGGTTLTTEEYAKIVGQALRQQR